MGSLIDQRRAFAAIQAVRLPDDWIRVTHTTWEIGALVYVSETDHRIAGHLSIIASGVSPPRVALGSATGLVDVTLNGCEICCEADEVQAAVDHCLAWWRAHPPPPFG